MKSKHENMYNKHHTVKTNKIHSSNSTRNTQTNIRTSFFFKTQQKHKIQEFKDFKHKNLWENKKTHTLFLNIGEEMMKKMEDFGVNTVSLWGRGMDKTMKSHKMQGKTEKFCENYLENNPHCAKRVFFVIGMSREQVVKNPCDKFWKICLSVFCDWKFHSRVSRNGSRQAFWVNLTTGASTRETVAKLSRDKPQNLGFWKISKSFPWLGAWLTRESRKLLSKLATEGARLDWLARVSRQYRVAQLLKFLTFFKIKTLSKNN